MHADPDDLGRGKIIKVVTTMFMGHRDIYLDS